MGLSYAVAVEQSGICELPHTMGTCFPACQVTKTLLANNEIRVSCDDIFALYASKRFFWLNMRDGISLWCEYKFKCYAVHLSRVCSLECPWVF